MGPAHGARRHACLAAWMMGATCAVGVAADAAAQEGALLVTVQDTTARVVDPGGVVSVAYLIRNRGAAPVAADVGAEVPARWRAVTGEGRLDLAGSTSDLHLVGIAVPADAPAGTYRVGVAVRPTGAAPSVGPAVTVRVRARRRLSLAVGRVPEFVAAGERFEATFVAANVGNTTVTVHLVARGGDGLRADADSSPVTIASAETRIVRVRGRADPAQTLAGGARLVRLVARTEGPPGEPAASVSATATVTVLPAAADPGDLFARLPTTLTLRGGHTGTPGRGAAPGVEWSGGGVIGAPAEVRVDFLARRSTAGVSPLGERDEYHLRLGRPGLDVRLGDQLTMLSPLTEPGRYARGLGARVARDAWSVGAFADRGRPRARGDEERGAFARASHGDAEFGVQYLNVGGLAPGQALSARARRAGRARTRADAEYGAGLGAAGGRAWGLSAAADHTALAYDLRIAEADSAYPGPVGGVRERSGRATLRPWRALRIGVQYDARRTVPTTTRPAPAERSALGAASIGVGDRVGVRFREAEWERRVFGTQFTARERAAEVRVASARGSARVAARVEVGTFADRRTPTESPFRSGHVEASLALRWGTTLGGYLGATDGRSLRNWSGAWTRSAGVSAELGLGRVTSARLSAAIDAIDAIDAMDAAATTGAGWAGRTARLEIEAVRLLPRSHELTLHVRVPPRGGASVQVARPTAQLAYRLPLAPPVGVRRDVGRLEVRVTDALTGQGIAGVVLRAGATVLVTAGDGRTGAVSLPPGTHALRIERTGPEAGLVPELPLAAEVVEAGRTVRVNVTLVRSARFGGRVRRYVAVGSRLAVGTARALSDADGVPGLIVVLSRGAETLRRVTDAEGGFSFEGLRPGRWELQVVGEIPTDHTLERAATEVELAPGATQQVAWRVAPRERHVQMTQEAELVAEPAPPAAPVRLRSRTP